MEKIASSYLPAMTGLAYLCLKKLYSHCETQFYQAHQDFMTAKKIKN